MKIWDFLNRTSVLVTLAGSPPIIGGILEDFGPTTIFLYTIVSIAVVLLIRHLLIQHRLKYPWRDKREDRSYNALENYFSKKSIRMLDFIGPEGEPIIKDKVFEDCVVYGPCVLAILGMHNKFDGSGFKLGAGGNLEDALIIKPPSTGKAHGVIGIDGCTFKRCTFKGVGIMAGENVLNKFRETPKVPKPF